MSSRHPNTSSAENNKKLLLEGEKEIDLTTTTSIVDLSTSTKNNSASAEDLSLKRTRKKVEEEGEENNSGEGTSVGHSVNNNKRVKYTQAADTTSSNNNNTKSSENNTTMNNSNNGMASGSAASSNSNSNQNDGKLDEGLYSRQIYVLGKKAMMNMMSSKIMICGLGGLGVEVAKNIILSGVKSVTLYDNKNATVQDLSSQFYLSKASLGKNRAQESYEKLSSLNSYVNVDVITGQLTSEVISGYNLVIVTEFDENYDDFLKLTQQAHEKGIKLVLAETMGLFARVFVDFGKKFEVRDTNGENPSSAMLAMITKDEEGIHVSCLDEARHGFEDGDTIVFTEVEGCTQLNNMEGLKVSNAKQFDFRINMDPKELGEYKKGGVATQVKVPQYFDFRSFNEALTTLKSPDILITDFAKMDHGPQLYIFFQALNKYRARFGKLPTVNDQADFLDLAKQILNERPNPMDDNEQIIFEDMDEKLLKTFLRNTNGQLCPMNAFVGGVVAQEALKGLTGKFMPIKQWLFYDAIECLEHEENVENSPATSERYSGQVAVFGPKFQEKLANLKYFIVGAGAIGCELLKNFAMMGIGTGPDGELIITDMDHIEKSNLNRQFLFRNEDISRPKSIVASNAALKMNPELKLFSHENRVGPETEGIYDDEFFERLDGVANALDNVDARIYMDRRCVYYRKPMLDSGTLGTKGNTQVVLPYLTESYSSSQDPPEKSIPICTLKNFPNQIEHTLQWARDLFEGVFRQQAENAASFLQDSRFIEKTSRLPGSQPLDILESVKKGLIDERPNKFFDCVKFARFLWDENFNNQIQQLLFNFPPDQKTTNGQLFWSGPKKCPRPFVFSTDDPLCLNFVMTAANLRAEVYGIKEGVTRDLKEIAEIVNTIEVPNFVPRSGVRIAVTDQEAQNMNQGGCDVTRIEDLKQALTSYNTAGVRISPIEFEKDDDNNLHIDFIAAASNSRARNYSIEPADRLQSKLIAGKIIPAIATTTSVVSGLICLEIYKLLMKEKKMDIFKNGFINLALPFFGFSEPMPAPKNKYYDTDWTLWDRFEVEGEMTLKDFIEYFQTKHKLEITMISQGVSMLYSFFMAKDKREERLQMQMVDVVRQVSKKRLEPHVRALVFELCCNDDKGDDVEIPYVRYKIPENLLNPA